MEIEPFKKEKQERDIMTMINCVSQKTTRKESRKLKYETQLQERKSSEKN